MFVRHNMCVFLVMCVSKCRCKVTAIINRKSDNFSPPMILTYVNRANAMNYNHIVEKKFSIVNADIFRRDVPLARMIGAK